MSSATAVPVEWLVRFHRPAALLRLHDLPARGDGLDPVAFGLAAAELRRARAGLRAEVAAAARELVAELDLDRAGFPFGDGEVVVGLGDSITSDALSWFEILRGVGAEVGSTARFHNEGVSGDTSADLRKRAFRVLERRPDRVLVLVGVNDCQRHAPGGDILVAPRETARNLWALRSVLTRRAGVRLAWLTPPPVDPHAVAATDVLAARGLAFDARDLAELGEALRRLPDPVVDVQRCFADGDPALWEDGVHPTLAGHRLIAREVLGEVVRLQ